jgi:hypothetical protein
MAERTDRWARSVMGDHVDEAIEKGVLRPSEREKAIDRACDNWVGQQGNGRAAEIAIKSVVADG